MAVRRTRRATIRFCHVLLSTSIGVACGGCSLGEPFGDQIAEVFEERDLGPPRRVFVRRFVAPIRSAPAPNAPRLGYLRAGALLHSTTSLPIADDGCKGGWFELDSGGFVCAGSDVTIFSGEKLPERRAVQPDRDATMPYEYATVRRRTPLYRRLPSADEIVDLAARPMEAEAGGTSAEEHNPLILRVLEPGFYVSLDRTFEREGRVYWRTQQNGFVPDASLRRKRGSAFEGQSLDGRDWSLPVAVTRDETALYRVTRRGGVRATRDRVSARTWLPVESRRQFGGEVYLVVGAGRLVREASVIVIGPSAPPPDVLDGERWIDIDLGRQVLVAYDWLQPRYVTLISSGRRNAPRPELDYRTPRGSLRIRAKHLTATMDNDEPGEPPYSLEDVPYVMYFKGAYAFHSAFWHDSFGRPRSHGCINLAPRDAKWLYNWAGPVVPTTWHGGYATDENPGTMVVIRGETP